MDSAVPTSPIARMAPNGTYSALAVSVLMGLFGTALSVRRRYNAQGDNIEMFRTNANVQKDFT